MYRLDWLEQLKLRATALPNAAEVGRVHPAVWKLGFTSLLTDVSAEMVNSILPMYVVLHLHLSPLQFGAVDGVYHGVAVALLGLAGGVIADRTRRPKEVAFSGYAISAVCKLLMLAVGGAWAWITLVTAIDRTGKGARTAPRDALISLYSTKPQLASAFAVHRALDAGGSLLGPLVAFALIQRMPGAYDSIWVTSFVFALLGLAVLWLFVKNPVLAAGETATARPSLGDAFRLLRGTRFRALTIAGCALALMTVSDGFLYLQLQQRSASPSSFFPLFYVATATCYAIFSVPVGRIADRVSRELVLLGGYGVLGLAYAFLMSSERMGTVSQVFFLSLLGIYYAATEGVLMAMASAVIPTGLRTSGLAVITTAVGLGKMASSLLFGWVWHTWDAITALIWFMAGLVVALGSAWVLLARRDPDAGEPIE